MTHPNIKLTSDKAAAVNLDVHWIPVKDHPPPTGTKLLLINRALGVVTIGSYSERFNFSHWQALPRFPD